jgi:hypothetical protein
VPQRCTAAWRDDRCCTRRHLCMSPFRSIATSVSWRHSAAVFQVPTGYDLKYRGISPLQDATLYCAAAAIVPTLYPTRHAPLLLLLRLLHTPVYPSICLTNDTSMQLPLWLCVPPEERHGHICASCKAEGSSVPHTAHDTFRRIDLSLASQPVQPYNPARKQRHG